MNSLMKCFLLRLHKTFIIFPSCQLLVHGTLKNDDLTVVGSQRQLPKILLCLYFQNICLVVSIISELKKILFIRKWCFHFQNFGKQAVGSINICHIKSILKCQKEKIIARSSFNEMVTCPFIQTLSIIFQTMIPLYHNSIQNIIIMF